MNCDHARDLILTDYIDTEISPEDKRELLQHLVDCESCRALLSCAEGSLVDPFAGAARFSPPPELAERVFQRIDAPAEDLAPVSWVQRLRSLFLPPQRAVALVLVGGMAVSLFLVTPEVPPLAGPRALSPSEQAVLSLMEDSTVATANLVRRISFETPLEKIFLSGNFFEDGDGQTGEGQ